MPRPGFALNVTLQDNESKQGVKDESDQKARAELKSQAISVGSLVSLKLKWLGMSRAKGQPYDERKYRIDPETGNLLTTTVMWDGNEKIVGTTAVKERLRMRLLDKAEELGGRNLKTGMFIEAFRTRGPSYGDVVRQVIRELAELELMRIRNIGTERNPRYVYDVA